MKKVANSSLDLLMQIPRPPLTLSLGGRGRLFSLGILLVSVAFLLRIFRGRSVFEIIIDFKILLVFYVSLSVLLYPNVVIIVIGYWYLINFIRSILNGILGGGEFQLPTK